MSLLNERSQGIEYLKLSWNVQLLNKIIGYVFKKTKNISNLQLRNVQKLLMNCDYTDYLNRPIIMDRIEFILKALEARLEKKLEDEGIILEYCTPDNSNPVIEEVVKNLDRYKNLNYSEIEFISTFVQDRLTNGIFLNKVKEMKTIIEMMEDNEFPTYADANKRVTEWINDYNMARRQISTSWNDDVLDFNDPNIEERVSEINARLGDTSSIIITGIIMLNEMLSPGFRPGKLYMFLGLTGGFKSAMLLKIILDCAKYNAGTYKPKKEGAKPYVLYLTMENTIDESFARVWNMAVEDTDVEKSKPSEIVKRLKEEKIVANDEIGILFAYRPNMSISTADLRDIIDEIESMGREVIMVSFDYIKRIRPQQRAKDEKEMLKNVTNELRQIAIDYQIPVISAHQFNRNALATVNNAMRDGKTDLAKFLGGENVGSAYEVMENPDMSIVLNLERKKDDNQLYLTFYRIKARYRPSTQLGYFNQPFKKGSSFQLDDDVTTGTPKGIISLDTNMEGADVNSLLPSRGRTNHELFSDIRKPEENSTFDLHALDKGEYGYNDY